MTKTISALFLLLVANQVWAQPEVSFEFSNEFGQFGFYTRTFPPNQIPPPGFSSPTGITFQRADRIIVADRGNLKMQSCDLLGESCFWIGGDSQGFGGRNYPGGFDLPHGVEANTEGLFALADEDNHWLQKCNDTGGCSVSGPQGTQFQEPSSALGAWAFPQDTAFDSNGHIYGMDTGNDRIQIIDGDELRFKSSFMRSGSALGRVDGARGISIDAQDQVIIADTGNDRIQICDTSANCTAFGSTGSGVGNFRGPVGVEVDDLGRIWVADTGNNRIQACDYEGNCVAFGELGTGEGQFNQPHDVAYHPTGKIAVVDTVNNRIQFFNTESAFTINAGMNEAWLNTATPGQGFFITVFPKQSAMFLANFSFDVAAQDENAGVQEALATANFGSDDQRWITGFGNYSGSQAVLEAELTSGGTFNSPTPAPTQTSGYGTYRVTFSDCSNGTISYEFPSLNLAGDIPISRLANDNVALCEALQGQ